MSTKGIIENAYMYLHSPYLWGGRTPFGIDCSGFTQMVYKLAGIRLKRDASQQAEQGTLINLIDEARQGDLAFFDNEEGRIIHVGIMLPNNKIIHASGKVRIDSIDHHGIYNLETKKYTHNLRIIKRFV
jgi:cell wall-associated NlpC family hydrolase